MPRERPERLRDPGGGIESALDRAPSLDRQGAVRRLLTAVSRTPQGRGPREPSG